MKNSLTTVLPGVDHQSEALVQFLVPCYRAGCLEKAAKLFGFIAFRYIRHMLFRNHQDMTGRLGIDISEGQPVVSLGNYIGRNPALDNLAEKAIVGLFLEIVFGFSVHLIKTILRIVRIVRDDYGEKL